jgi:hypothetical protein
LQHNEDTWYQHHSHDSEYLNFPST